MVRVFGSAGLGVLLSAAALCQQAADKPKFDIADVHVSPRSDWAKIPANNMRGGFLAGERYELRRATMLDLIKTAYSIDADKLYGGPSWLDYDRFEVIAKAPAATRPEDLKLMLQSLLADRFKLVIKMDTRPLPAYVLSIGKEKLKLKAATGSDSGGCRNQRPPVPRTTLIQCRGVTMEAFASALRRHVANPPVVDSTGLDGAWDIDLQFSAMIDSKTGIVEAVGKELGLTLELSKTPQQVLVVESVNEQPSANPPGVAAVLPPVPAPEFEVASIRPCDGTGSSISPRFEPGGRVTMNCIPLLSLIGRVFNVNSSSPQLANVPKWVDPSSTKDNFSLVARAPAGTVPDAVNTPQAQDILDAMMRALLIDRFKFAFHYEDRPMEAYTLAALKPKLTKANPENRTGCQRNAVRIVCQNITMAQFAEQIQSYDPDILCPVLDGTGIDGAWDFTLNYSGLANGMAKLSASLAAKGVALPATAAPSPGPISFAEALEKQLGLKLEKHTRPEPVLVIDHLEEKPTGN